jgi:hypothetical protein
MYAVQLAPHIGAPATTSKAKREFARSAALNGRIPRPTSSDAARNWTMDRSPRRLQ